MRLLMPLIILLSLCTTATAETYRWTDENGKVHFTDKPPTESNAEEMELRGPDKLGQDPDSRTRQERALEMLESSSREQRQERLERERSKQTAHRQECLQKRRELHRLKRPTRYGDRDDAELSEDELEAKEARALELAQWVHKNCLL